MAKVNHSLGITSGGSFLQDNIFVPITVYVDSDPISYSAVATAINALPQFTVNETSLPLFLIINGTTSEFEVLIRNISRFIFKSIGKGTYGVDGIQITAANIEMISIFEPNITDIGSIATTDIIDLGEIGDTPVDEYVNALTTSIIVQDQEDGYTIISTLVDGIRVDYLFIGAGGTYGISDDSITSDDYQLLASAPGLQNLQTTLDVGNVATTPIYIGTLGDENYSAQMVDAGFYAGLNGAIEGTTSGFFGAVDISKVGISSIFEDGGEFFTKAVEISNDSILGTNPFIQFFDSLNNYSSKISFDNIGGQNINFLLPNAAINTDHVLPISVNGEIADNAGNITLSISGDQNLQSVTDFGDSTTNELFLLGGLSVGDNILGGIITFPITGSTIDDDGGTLNFYHPNGVYVVAGTMSITIDDTTNLMQFAGNTGVGYKFDFTKSPGPYTIASLDDIPGPQDLQSVLNTGNVSTTELNVTDGTDTVSLYSGSIEVNNLSGDYAILQLSNITVGNSSESTSLTPNSLALANSGLTSRIKSSNVTNNNVILEFPNKATGSYTIATTSDITSPTTIVGITGTKAEFDTAVTDGNFLYVGDVTQYTDAMAKAAAVANDLIAATDVAPSKTAVNTALASKASKAVVTNYSGSTTVVGFSSISTLTVNVVENEFQYDVYFSINGTSNDTEFTFTVPFNAGITMVQTGYYIANNGAVSDAGRVGTVSGSNVISIRSSANGATFTASGTKACQGRVSILK